MREEPIPVVHQDLLGCLRVLESKNDHNAVRRLLFCNGIHIFDVKIPFTKAAQRRQQRARRISDFHCQHRRLGTGYAVFLQRSSGIRGLVNDHAN